MVHSMVFELFSINSPRCAYFSVLHTNHFMPFEVKLIKAGPLRQKQPTNKLKIKILSETSILYLIRHASVILPVGLNL